MTPAAASETIHGKASTSCRVHQVESYITLIFTANHARVPSVYQESVVPKISFESSFLKISLIFCVSIHFRPGVK